MDEMFFYESRRPVFDENDDIHYKVKAKPKEKKVNSKRNAIACGVAIAITIFLVGIGLGFWSCRLQHSVADTGKSDGKKTARRDVVLYKDIVAKIDRREIEMHLRFAKNIAWINTSLCLVYCRYKRAATNHSGTGCS
jgi:hypothetical protein